MVDPIDPSKLGIITRAFGERPIGKWLMGLGVILFFVFFCSLRVYYRILDIWKFEVMGG